MMNPSTPGDRLRYGTPCLNESYKKTMDIGKLSRRLFFDRPKSVRTGYTPHALAS